MYFFYVMEHNILYFNFVTENTQTIIYKHEIYKIMNAGENDVNRTFSSEIIRYLNNIWPVKMYYYELDL